jgi:hypothetical protein
LSFCPNDAFAKTDTFLGRARSTAQTRLQRITPPFTAAAVGSQGDGALFVARIDNLEKQLAAVRADRQVPNFTHDQQAVPRDESYTLREITLSARDTFWEQSHG